MICVSHYSKIKLNLGKIREKIIKDCEGVKNPFIRVRVLRSSAKNDLEKFEEYINKNVKK